ncbi:MAG: hypothetical protein QXS92_00120 [Thermofilum sp.]
MITALYILAVFARMQAEQSRLEDGAQTCLEEGALQRLLSLLTGALGD